MKKIIITILVTGVVVLGGAVYFLFSNLDALVKQGIETAGSDAVGTAVTVDSVSISLSEGRASIYGFAVANPEGFTTGDMLSFDELSVTLDVSKLDITNLSADNIAILSVVSRNPRVIYESRNGTTNLDVVNAKLSSGSDSSATDDSSASPVRLSIGSIIIDDIEGMMISDKLPRNLEVSLGDIDLRNLQGTPEEIASQITKPLISQLASNAGKALLQATADELKEKATEKAEELKVQATEKAEQALDGAKEKAEDKLREGFGNLLKRD